jgi:3-dehydroquinate dehydratase-1
MRIQAKKPIKLRGKIIGGEAPLVCIPIVAAEEPELESQAKNIAELCPDIIEWRVDYFKDVCDLKMVKKALKTIRDIISDIPIIFTFRSSLEGGFLEVKDDIRFSIIEQIINTGEVDVVDIELISGKAKIEKIKRTAKTNNVPLILSYHNFSKTPSVEFMLDKIKQQVSNGANIAKIAVMPENEEDVLNLLSATLKARKDLPDIPLITMSMGDLGIISRIAGGIFGSDLTFGACGKTSAPGQIPITELREAMKPL